MADTLKATLSAVAADLVQLAARIEALPILHGSQTVEDVLKATENDRLFFELVQRRATLLTEVVVQAKARKKPKTAGKAAVDLLGQAIVDISDIKSAEMLTMTLQDEADLHARSAEELLEAVKEYDSRLPAN